MIAVMHQPSLKENFDAVYWERDGELMEVFVGPDDTYSLRMARAALAQKAEDRTWEVLFRQLDSHNPNPASWSLIEVESSEEAVRRLRDSQET